MAKKQKILLVEDEKILAEMYKDKFIKAGYNVEVAFDAEEAIKFARKQKPDLIILDILLPRDNGIAFLEFYNRIGKIHKIQFLNLN